MSQQSVILCTAGYDHTIRFWEALSGLCCRQIPHTDSQINRLCISPNKAFLAVAGRFKIYLYSCRAPESSHRGPSTTSQSTSDPERTFEGHSANITGVAFHIDSKWMVTSSEDGTVKVWDTKTQVKQRDYNHGCPVNDVVIHPNQGEVISCDRGGNVRVWDLSNNKCSHQLIPEDDVSVSSVSVAADGSCLCAGNNAGNIYIWRLTTAPGGTTVLTPYTRFAAHIGYITRVLISPDSRLLATCSSDHTAKVWNIRLDMPAPEPEKERQASLRDAENGEEDDALSASAAYKTANADPALQHTHAQPTKPTAPAPVPPTPTRLPLRPSSNHNTSSSNQRSLPTPLIPVRNNPTNIPLRDPRAFTQHSELSEHQRWVWDCAFSADSAYLVTACSDHYARLWDLGEKTVIRQYQGHHRGLVCVALNDYSNG